MSERYETEDIVDNGAIVRTDITRVTNTSSQPERVLTEADYQQAWDNLKNAMVPVLKDLAKVWDELRQQGQLMDTIAQLHAIDQGTRYWHDHQGQPRRTPNMRPILHNGGKPR